MRKSTHLKNSKSDVHLEMGDAKEHSPKNSKSDVHLEMGDAKEHSPFHAPLTLSTLLPHEESASGHPQLSSHSHYACWEGTLDNVLESVLCTQIC